MKFANKIYDLVGKTPLLRLEGLSNETGTNVFLKLEFLNPLSSVKDRIALAMIEDAEKSGILKADTEIVEATSGNTGIGLAFVAASKGYKISLVMPDSMSIERRKLIQVLGAELVLTPAADGMAGSIAKAKELTDNNENSISLDQFSNPANPKTHNETTGPEIWNDLDGKVDAFISAVGTGGTFSGAGSFLKYKNNDIDLIAVEPEESAVLSGESPKSHKIQGIGAGFIPKNMDVKLISEIIKVNAERAGIASRYLATNEGILVGISSGANLAAAKTYAMRPENKGKNIVTIMCDTGERYLSTWLFDNW